MPGSERAVKKIKKFSHSNRVYNFKKYITAAFSFFRDQNIFIDLAKLWRWSWTYFFALLLYCTRSYGMYVYAPCYLEKSDVRVRRWLWAHLSSLLG